MVFTMFSAHSHFVQTLFFQSFPCKFASKFRLFFALFFIEKIEKICSKIDVFVLKALEVPGPQKGSRTGFYMILGRFWINFGGFWEAWGGWWEAFLEFFGPPKKGAKFERILGSIFEDSRAGAAGNAVPV